MDSDPRQTPVAHPAPAVILPLFGELALEVGPLALAVGIGLAQGLEMGPILLEDNATALAAGLRPLQRQRLQPEVLSVRLDCRVVVLHLHVLVHRMAVV